MHLNLPAQFKKKQKDRGNFDSKPVRPCTFFFSKYCTFTVKRMTECICLCEWVGGWRESVCLQGLHTSPGCQCSSRCAPLHLYCWRNNSHVRQSEESMTAKGATSQVDEQSRAQQCSSIRATLPWELGGYSLLGGVPCLCSALSLLQEFCCNVQFFTDPASFWQKKKGEASSSGLC